MLVALILSGVECMRADPVHRPQSATNAKKRVTEVPIFVHYPAAPENIDEMISRSEAVVVGRYVGSRRLTQAVPGDVSSIHSFDVVEVIKAGGRLPPSRLEYMLPGGAVELTDEVVVFKPHDIVPFESGRVYVMFLTINPVRDTFTVNWGPSGIFDITDGRVAPVDTFQRRHSGKEVAAFLTAIRDSAPR